MLLLVFIGSLLNIHLLVEMLKNLFKNSFSFQFVQQVGFFQGNMIIPFETKNGEYLQKANVQLLTISVKLDTLGNWLEFAEILSAGKEKFDRI